MLMKKGSNMKNLNTMLLTAVALVGVTSVTQAIPMTLPNPAGSDDRIATLDSATDGAWGAGNAIAANVDGHFAVFAPWTERGEAVGADGTSEDPTGGSLTVEVTSGTWGSRLVAGTWTINDSSFWSSYANGAISMHVGNGGGDPDHFVWLLEGGKLSGTWSYDGTNARGGGGLSNLKLFSSGTGSNVPDGGATLALLGLSLIGIGGVRKIAGAKKA